MTTSESHPWTFVEEMFIGTMNEGSNGVSRSERTIQETNQDSRVTVSEGCSGSFFSHWKIGKNEAERKGSISDTLHAKHENHMKNVRTKITIAELLNN
jgi:hypothetical protein